VEFAHAGYWAFCRARCESGQSLFVFSLE
jgi:hypothetical protein